MALLGFGTPSSAGAPAYHTSALQKGRNEACFPLLARNRLVPSRTTLPRLGTPTTTYCPPPSVSFRVYCTQRPSWASLSSLLPDSSLQNLHTPHSSCPRAHPVFVESVPAELSEVYLKGHLRANEDTPLLAPARKTGSAVKEAHFFCWGRAAASAGSWASPSASRKSLGPPWPSKSGSPCRSPGPRQPG